MASLASVTIATGATALAAGAVAAADPARMRAWIARFPRSTIAAWVLAAADLLWSGWLLWQTPLGRFDGLKPWLFAVVPACFFLVVRYMDDLLATRALGGLLLLVPAPILEAGRWHPSPFRYVMLGLAYALVAAGLTLVLSPYEFRRAAEVLLRGRDGRCRAGGATLAAVGAALIALGLTAYSI